MAIELDTTALEERRSTSPGPASNRAAFWGLMAAIVVPLLPIGRWIAPGHSLAALLSRELLWWIYAAAVSLWLTRVERLPVRSVGFRRSTWKTLAFAVLAAAALLAVMTFHYAVIVRVFHLDTAAALHQQQMILSLPFWVRVLIVLRAAVVEEILFRGYIIEKVRQITSSSALAVAISVVAFAAAHFAGWGLVQLIPVAGGALILALLYVWRRDLPSNMLAHFLTDGAGFLLR
jgi:uncharacterized protein